MNRIQGWSIYVLDVGFATYRMFVFTDLPYFGITERPYLQFTDDVLARSRRIGRLDGWNDGPTVQHALAVSVYSK